MRRAGRLAALALALLPAWAGADRIRVATFDTELQRDGPGLLLRDIEGGRDPQVAAVAEIVAHAAPDVLALQGIDWDHEGRALEALRRALAEAGVRFDHTLALRPNSGLATGLDMDGDGRLGEPEDAQSFGAFTGQGGIAVLSRFPIRAEGVQDFSALLWRDLPGALLPVHADGTPFPSQAAQAAQRLSTTGHWAVPVDLPGGAVLTLLTFKATPPVFDGTEDLNGRRNHDEIAFWRAWLDGAFGPVPPDRIVLAGNANLDPEDSDGRREAIAALLGDPRLVDPAPASAGAAAAPDQGHAGANRLDTVDWEGAGRLRVDYVLPSADWRVLGAGVVWPAPGEPLSETAAAASRHRLVWVDLALD